jgi:hypothetical protein
MMERANAIVTAARASVLSAFTSGQGYSADADYSPRAWLIHKTRVTKVVAVAHTAWAKRTVTHPQVLAALTAEDLSESYGRTICQWTDKLPDDCRPAADAILLSAAKAGMDLRDLAALAAEMYERSRCDLPDEDPAQGFEDRAVSLEPTFQGAGVLNGDLTPECAAVVGAVLDALGAPAGAEDSRPVVHLRRLGHPGSDRRGKPGRAGGSDPAVRRAGQAPPGRGTTTKTPVIRHRTRLPKRRWSRRSSARPSTSCRARAAWRASCGAGSWGRGWAGRACRWMSAFPLTSRPRSGGR